MTAKEKAHSLVNELALITDYKVMHKRLVLALKEQDRDTRHACAEAVAAIAPDYSAPTGTDLISPDAAHAACMNAKAV